MKKKFFSLFLCGILSICLAFSSCQYLSLPNFESKSIISAELNDKGELVLSYSDNTTQNLGVVKGENGKDGKDGVDLTPCAHVYGDWTTVLAPTCTSIGYDTRSCSLCGDLDCQFMEAAGHTYEDPVGLVHTCQQHFLNKTCTTCGDTALVEEPATKDHFYGDWKTVEEYACGAIKQEKSCIYCNEKQIQTLNFSAHTFDEKTLCTTCGHQEFIKSEEYIDTSTYKGYPVTRWWNKDKSYALLLGYTGGLSSAPWYTIAGYEGTPVNIVLPNTFSGDSILSIGGGLGVLGDLPCYGFKNCTTLESIIITEGLTEINRSVFENCTSLCKIILPNSLTRIGPNSFYCCFSLTEIKIPKSVEKPFDPFDNCPSLLKIYAHQNCIINKEDYFNHHPDLEIIRYE